MSPESLYLGQLVVENVEILNAVSQALGLDWLLSRLSASLLHALQSSVRAHQGPGHFRRLHWSLQAIPSLTCPTISALHRPLSHLLLIVSTSEISRSWPLLHAIEPRHSPSLVPLILFRNQ